MKRNVWFTVHGEQQYEGMTPDSAVLMRLGAVTSEMIFRPGETHTTYYATPYGTFPLTVETESVHWKFDERGGMLSLRYHIDLGGQKGKCALRIRAKAKE